MRTLNLFQAEVPVSNSFFLHLSYVPTLFSFLMKLLPFIQKSFTESFQGLTVKWLHFCTALIPFAKPYLLVCFLLISLLDTLYYNILTWYIIFEISSTASLIIPLKTHYFLNFLAFYFIKPLSNQIKLGSSFPTQTMAQQPICFWSALLTNKGQMICITKEI